MPTAPRSRAAALLCTARLERARIDSLPEDVRPADEAEAYLVQGELHERLREAGWGAIVGRKIGCTTPVMQSYMNIDHPCAGGIFGPTVHRLTANLEAAAYVRPGVECEVAVRLAADLGPRQAPFERASVARAIGACATAIEVVDDRYADYALLGTPTLIADDFFGAGCVVGAEVEGIDPLELDRVRGTMWIDGEETGSGAGTDVLGHPLDALVWLATSMAERGATLHAGELILLGSLVRTQWVGAGADVRIRTEPLGEASVRFA
jgi:2-keto-4-pentenoate hydratase